MANLVFLKTDKKLDLFPLASVWRIGKFVPYLKTIVLTAKNMTTIEDKLNKEIRTYMNSFEVTFMSGDLEKKTRITYEEFFTDRVLIINAIRKGIPFNLFAVIQAYTPFSEKDWTSFLHLSSKTLQRYKNEKRLFEPLQSEKIMEIAEVTKLGMDVFGDAERFRLWLDTPNYALGNLTPTELLKDSYGKELVLTELHHINHGIFV